MIKVDIVNEVSKVADITKVKAEVAVDAVFDAMRLSMQRGERIELRGFGVFQVKPRKRGIGRNPRTGKEVRIPPGRTIRFKPGKDLQNIGGGNLPIARILENEIPARTPSPQDDPVFRTDGFEPERSFPAFTVPAPRQRFQHKTWKHVLLFVATLVTTTMAGACHYEAFVSDFNRVPVTPDLSGFLLNGLWYSVTILAILGAHEFGHYYLCRKYNVDATLPYFLPAPLLTGTLGAVIRIREPFPTRTALFDIGVAGPIGGFIVLVPALFIGMMLSKLTTEPPISAGLVALGEPMLFRLAERLVFGALPEGQALNIHPIVFAAWFGMPRSEERRVG